AKVILEEENSFLKTLENGLKRLDSIIKESNKTIEGKAAFELLDTYGFPIDLTKLIALENGLNVDENEFEIELQKQKDR
ncbi:MAG TPA: alanine--tRNA ligase-related protein, partial [Chitinophagales bacterium]|nr:alanine--tRNA ligase-related protein [Chitinophagales bacterium]